MIGKIFITREGYDPEQGRHIKDPYLGDNPSIGACRPDVRKQIVIGGQIYVISGKVDGVDQFVMGGLEVAEKIPMTEAFKRFPDQRLRQRDDGQLDGNVIVTARGKQHRLDDHKNFDKRIDNYVIGKNPIALVTPREIAIGRKETLDALQEILQKSGKTPRQVVTRFGRNLTEEQCEALRAWLLKIKKNAA